MKLTETHTGKNTSDLLYGITILVTRAREQAAGFISTLKSFGAEVIEFPSIRIIEADNKKEYNQVIGKFDTYDIIVFNSANAVNYFMKKLPDNAKKQIPSKKIFAIGPKTQDATTHWKIRSEVINSVYTGHELGNAIAKIVEKGSHVLFPHGNLGNHELAGILKESGMQVTGLTVYMNSEPDKEDIKKFRSKTENKKIDVITFFSPSSIHNLLKVMKIPPTCRIAVIGPTTARAAESAGLKADIIAEKTTSEHLASAIVEYYKLNRKKISLHD